MSKYKIKSISKYLPGEPISAIELEQKVGMPRGWIAKNSGVLSRHRAMEEDSVVKMGAKSLCRAMDNSNLSMRDIDQLIFCSGTYDYPIPYNACLLKKELKAENDTTPCFDIDATCLSFLVGLDVGFAMMNRPQMERIALVSSELSSKSLDPTDFKTYSLFGDASVACILEKSEEGFSVLGSLFENYCEGAEFAQVPAGGSVLLGSQEGIDKEKFYFKMKGKALLKLTFQKLDGYLERLEKQTGTRIQDYDYIIQHQTSKFGNQFFLKKYDLKPNQVYHGLAKYGNCISASIGMGLEEGINQGKIKKGDKVLLLGTAAGLSLGAIALQF